MGSPCDPQEYCSDKDSTDPVVIDHCEDIWSDIDECIINPSTCDEEGNPLPVRPLCDENTSPGTLCSDEGDMDDNTGGIECPDAGPEICGDEETPPEDDTGDEENGGDIRDDESGSGEGEDSGSSSFG